MCELFLGTLLILLAETTSNTKHQEHNLLVVVLTSATVEISIPKRPPTAMAVSFFCSPVALLAFVAAATATPHDATSNTSIIGPEFVATPTYRIERQFVANLTAQKVLHDLVHQGVPLESEDDLFPREAVRKIGDAGQKDVSQYDVAEYSSVLQHFSTPEYHHPPGSSNNKHSVVYYIEQTDGPSLERAKEILSNVASPSILGNGGTAHLYMSAPGTSALGNHTDTTDIVVLQLAGVKEWYLCSDNSSSPDSAALRGAGGTAFSRKLNACSTYDTSEMENSSLMGDCQRTTLHPGDVLFLPRRVVHSARALADTFSAHLTFGYQEDQMCPVWNSESWYGHHSRKLCYSCGCNQSCDSGCDPGTWQSRCDTRCDSSCDRVCGCD